MNILLNKSLEEFVKEKVSSGSYHSASEVIRAGLMILKEQDLDLDKKLTVCLKQIEEGKYSDADDDFWDRIEKNVKRNTIKS